jgi:hypothetical protein
VKALKNERAGVNHKRAETFPSVVVVSRVVRRRMRNGVFVMMWCQAVGSS